MTLADRILELKISIVSGLSSLIDTIATKGFNYPENLGMPIHQYDDRQLAVWKYVSKLPMHVTQVPPAAVPKTLSQAIFGNFPVLPTIERTFYEHKSDGFYNFYIPNYRNIFFLPDWLSQWIQLNLDISIDTTSLELFRQGIFFGFLAFLLIMELRIRLFWFLTINPYTRPWLYLIALTDWVYDVMAGFTPVFMGLDLTPTLLLGVIGKVMDSLNHLVFTMPFLPSEGVPGKMMIEGEMKDVILFRYLPSLWYTHPIPDKLREFWYKERPEILDFMEKNYKHLDIDFVPNRILKEIYKYQQEQNMIADSVQNLSTSMICQVSLYSHDLIGYLSEKHISAHDLSLIVKDTLIN